jgi:hypothetical protein
MRRAILFCVSVLFAGCHMFEDADNVDPCPLNSAYPCPCDVDTHPICDDESQCKATENDYRGFCSARCTEPVDCEETQGFGLEGVCELSIGTTSGTNNCVLVCDDTAVSAGCPPGMECQWREDRGYGICWPKSDASGE